ncbi:MAG: biopolymer transporter ExbD [Lautropia sp.]
MAAVQSRSRGRSKRLVNEINVVPYIDVMLVLLVIFMVTAPFVPTATIDLPTVGASQSKPEAFVEVIVDQSGALTLRTQNLPQQIERRATREQLLNTLAEMVGGNSALPVVISGDRQVRYEAVLDVMDLLKTQGVRRVGLMVKPRPGSGSGRP